MGVDAEQTVRCSAEGVVVPVLVLGPVIVFFDDDEAAFHGLAVVINVIYVIVQGRGSFSGSVSADLAGSAWSRLYLVKNAAASLPQRDCNSGRDCAWADVLSASASIPASIPLLTFTSLLLEPS
jgi:hypothetical protein